MNTISTSEARNNFSDILNKVIYQRENIILERHGKPIAVITPYSESLQTEPLK